jgi:hypothetical protein
VHSKGQKVTVEADQLINLLLKEASTKERTDIEGLIDILSTSLSSNQTLPSLNPKQLLFIGCKLGYYYRVFLTQNKVKIIHSHEDTNRTDSANQEPSSEESGSASS